MFRLERPKTNARTTLDMLELIFHAAVRSVRKGHRNALGGLLLNILQTVILILVFWFMGHYLGMMRNAIHGGNFVLYIMTGIFLFMTHTKAIGSVSKAEGPGQRLHFSIKALLIAHEANEVVSFDAVLMPVSQRYQVQRAKGA